MQMKAKPSWISVQMDPCSKMDPKQLQTQSASEPKRGQWVAKREFILSCLGYAIGIGNVWRFPYLCYRNGGGAFLVPYLIMLFFCGLPLYLMETSLGQFSSLGMISMFKIAPLFKGAGYAIVVVNVLCTAYYSLILTYPLLFIVNCFTKTLPWEHCNNTWNTKDCMEINSDGFNKSLFISSSGTITTPADEFFHKELLQIQDGINSLGSIVWPVFYGNIFSWIVMFFCIAKGVKSIGKVVYFTATFPFSVLLVLFIRGITLPGAMDGIKFYIYPKWDQLYNLSVWADAAVQIFYSLGPGWGGIVNMASYNKFNNNNLSDSLLIPIINCSTSIFAGFVVFSVLGFMSFKTGLPIEMVATGGPSLAFVTYPEAISLLPWSNLWAVLFFAMLFFLGIDSCFVQLEAVLSTISDEYPNFVKNKTVLAFLACIFFAVVSSICTTNAGIYIVQLMDWYCASISVILICLIEVVIIGWTYGCKRFVKDIEFMTGLKVLWIWPLLWKFITPCILTFIFVTTILWNTKVTYKGHEYPEWSIFFGWSLCLSSVLLIPIYIIYYLTTQTSGSLIQRIKESLTPSPDWGPADKEILFQWKNITYHILPMDEKIERKRISI